MHLQKVRKEEEENCMKICKFLDQGCAMCDEDCNCAACAKNKSDGLFDWKRISDTLPTEGKQCYVIFRNDECCFLERGRCFYKNSRFDIPADVIYWTEA